MSICWMRSNSCSCSGSAVIMYRWKGGGGEEVSRNESEVSQNNFLLYFLRSEADIKRAGCAAGILLECPRKIDCGLYRGITKHKPSNFERTFSFLSSLTYLASGESGSQSNWPCQKYLVFLVSLMNLWRQGTLR